MGFAAHLAFVELLVVSFVVSFVGESFRCCFLRLCPPGTPCSSRADSSTPEFANCV